MRIAHSIQQAVLNRDDQKVLVDFLRQKLSVLLLNLEDGMTPEDAVAKFQKDTGMSEVGLTIETCDCADCEASDPCHMDCDRDEECSGCREARLVEEENRFDADCASGRR